MFPLSRIVATGLIALISVLSALLPSQARADQATPVVVSAIQQGEGGDALRLTGSVFSRRYSKLSAEMAGLVRQLVPELGAYIKQGDLVCRIDDTFAALDVKDAGFLRQRATAALAEARRRYDEAVRLSKDKIVAETDIEALQSFVRISESELLRAELQESRAKEILDRYQIRAPFDGMVVSKQTEEGEWIDQGGAALTIVELDSVFVEFLVPQSFYHQIVRKRDVQISFEAIPDRRFSGAIHGVVALAGEGARSFPVRVELSNLDHAIAPGMSARGVFQTGEGVEQSVVLVPADAVVRTPEGRHSVWLVDDVFGKPVLAEERIVDLGSRQGNAFVLKAGDLNAGDLVIVRGNERLVEGQLVEVIIRLDEGGGR